MKKTLWMAVIFCGGALFAAENDKLNKVAYWDFENGLNSGSFQMQLRGNAAVVEDAEQGKVLMPGYNVKGAASGMILRGSARNELTPSGDFELSMKLKAAFPEKLDKNLQMTIFDTKYAAKKGLNLNFILEPSGRLNLRIELGYDGAEDIFIIRDVKIADGKWHQLKVIRTGNILQAFMNDKKLSEFKLKGDLKGSAHRLTLGDRVGAGYGAFAGFMDDISLSVADGGAE